MGDIGFQTRPQNEAAHPNQLILVEGTKYVASLKP